MTTPLVISAWSAVSPYGVGAEPFRAGIAGAASAVGPLDPELSPGPLTEGALVPGFTAAEYVGRKGTRTMDRVTALAVTAVGGLAKSLDLDLGAHPEQTGLVLGTGSGSVQSIMDFTRDSLEGERPYHVDPARFPNTVMNRAAGQSAIWHGIKGPNTTVAGGALTGLLALGYALRLYRGGHCVRVLCGAAEEHSAQRTWLEWHGRVKEERESPLGEGAAVVLLETPEAAGTAGRTPLAGIGAVRFRAFHEEDRAADALAVCVRDALKEAGIAPAAVRVVAPLGGGGPLAVQEEQTLREVLGEDAAPGEDTAPGAAVRLSLRPLLGDLSAAAGSLQVAAVLAAAGESGLAPGEAALITGVERDGLVGALVLTGN